MRREKEKKKKEYAKKEGGREEGREEKTNKGEGGRVRKKLGRREGSEIFRKKTRCLEYKKRGKGGEKKGKIGRRRAEWKE